MCGVVGVFGTPNRVNRHIFQDMLCMDVKRGPHSTGAVLASKKQVIIDKEVLLPWDFIGREGWKQQIKQNWSLMMGHNRWATVGGVTKENAHPFHHGNIIMTHNGTLDNEVKWDSYQDYSTDSEVMTAEIAKHGIEKVWGELEGAATCVWWDTDTNELNAISNGKRPFNFCMSADNKSMYYASEDWVFQLATSGRGVALEKNFFTLANNTWFRFKMNKGKITYTDKYIEPFRKVVVYPPNKAIPDVLGSTGVADHQNGSHGTKETTWKGGRGSSGIVCTVPYAGKGVECAGKANLIMQSAQYYAQFKGVSCALCASHPLFYDSVIIDEETVVCGECVENSCTIKVRLV